MAIAWLRPLAMSDLDNMMTWVNDPDIIGNFANFKHPVSRDNEKQYLERILGSDTDKVFAIEAEDGTYLGNIGLHGIHWPSRQSRFAIIIGNKDYWGGGYATSAIESLLDLAFDQYNLHKVWGMCWETNEKNKHLYIEKLGFTVEGTLRDDYFHQGKYHTMLRLGMLEDEWRVR